MGRTRNNQSLYVQRKQNKKNSSATVSSASKVSSVKAKDSPSLNIGSVKINELPTYVQNVAKYNFLFAIPQNYTVELLGTNMALLKAIKGLDSLISSQMITFRKSSIEKLYAQINKQCNLVFNLILKFLAQYNAMYGMYICPGAVVISNISEVNKFFLSLSNCYKNFENLIKKIKDEKIKKTWQENIKTIEIVQVRGNANQSVKFINMIIQGIIAPTVACATTIVAYEKELKQHTFISQHALSNELKDLEELKSNVQKKLSKILNFCNTRSEETLKQLKLQKKDAEIKKNRKLLNQITVLEYKTKKIKNRVQIVNIKLRNCMSTADQARKNTKYSDGEHVGILINLKSVLKEMVDYSQEIFGMMKDPKTTEAQRENKIKSITSKIQNCEKIIETTVEKVVWPTEKNDEVGQNTEKFRDIIHKAEEKIMKLNNNDDVEKLYQFVIEWEKAKPSSFIVFLQKYGKYIIMALGFILSIL